MGVYKDTETGKEYLIPETMEKYIDNLIKKNGIIYGEKKVCLLFRQAMSGRSLIVKKDNGSIEAEEIEKDDCYIVQNANLDGTPIPNSDGTPNEYQMTIETFRKKYELVPSISGFAKPKGGIQKFVQVDENMIVMVPWGENGSLIPLKVDAGGYLNITNPNDIYGIDAPIFEKTYKYWKE